MSQHPTLTAHVLHGALTEDERAALAYLLAALARRMDGEGDEAEVAYAYGIFTERCRQGSGTAS